MNTGLSIKCQKSMDESSKQIFEKVVVFVINHFTLKSYKLVRLSSRTNFCFSVIFKYAQKTFVWFTQTRRQTWARAT